MKSCDKKNQHKSGQQASNTRQCLALHRYTQHFSVFCVVNRKTREKKMKKTSEWMRNDKCLKGVGLGPTVISVFFFFGECDNCMNVRWLWSSVGQTRPDIMSLCRSLSTNGSYDNPSSPCSFPSTSDSHRLWQDETREEKKKQKYRKHRNATQQVLWWFLTLSLSCVSSKCVTKMFSAI